MQAADAPSLRYLPGGLFGAVMGLAGLGIAWRRAEGALTWHGEFWSLLGVLAFAALVAAYLAKWRRHPDAVRAELANPALLGFCAALPVGMTLVAASLRPYALPLAQAVWWGGVALLFVFQLWGLSLFLRGGVTAAQVNGGWMILFVGGIVVPSSGLDLGHELVSQWFFGVSATLAPFVMGLVLWRALFGPPLPDAVKPSTFILLVPPSLVYANGIALGVAENVFLQGLFFTGLVLLAAIAVAMRGCLRWPFGAPWWAFTFPLDALAAAAGLHAELHPSGPWKWIAQGLLLLATAVVTFVLARTLVALRTGQLLSAPPAVPPAPATSA